ncbi:MAG: flagellar basal body rod protein FlgC [Planctomycetes bacterium RBG_16_55_9]|nr:MAG: flagellar basal body rod protein FlgC [Planctomycetes bacterium RBG_16_55_9]
MKVDSSFGPIDIAISGLRAQSKQMEVISSNVANARTVDAGQGEPYRRHEVAFASDEELGGVKVGEILTDMSEFQKIIDPGNPLADESGYVTMPNVNLPIEMMNLNIAARVYQANVAVLRRYQQMVETTLELLR